MTPKTPTPRKEKKSEMLDVRLPYGLKQALVQACKDQGVTVSDTVRRLISDYIDAVEASDHSPAITEIAMKIAHNPIKSFGMAVITASAFALFAAQPSVAEDDLFASFDDDDNDLITEDELGLEIIELFDTDKNRALARGEFKRRGWSEATTDRVLASGDGSPIREVAYIHYQVMFDGPNSVVTHRSVCSENPPIDANAKDVSILIKTLKSECSEKAWES
ncbi:MAG: hypothetical protein AAF950_13340 [Pseudomonadota bacterium]